ncbi:mitochondrial fission factor-like isoform X2 [Cheilinus undulatus]|uniref:mitochondrial fission factor-like isoform X2 n=1 Tax=Cheilinus undulatus TaxID=241271 RepID=UPI001BD42B8E|nr:mitochondrial fission factor-like isoform X2 [Cheilinus undulatus]
MSQDPAFMEAISKHMRVPERLSVGPGQQWRREEEEEEATRREEEVPPVLTMQVPDRLTYTEAPDMSPSPLSKLTVCGPLSLDPCWESPSGEVFIREAPQSPIRRSYSDQSFGRTPPGTPTRLRQNLAVPRHHSSIRASNHPLLQRSSPSTHTSDPDAPSQPSSPLSLSSPQSILQMARTLGLQASQCLLQAVSQKYRFKNQGKPPAARFNDEVPVSAQMEKVELSRRR